MKKEEKMLKEIIDRMMEIAGHAVRYDDLCGRSDDWYNQFTMTSAQREEWVEWTVKYMKKKMKMTAEGARRDMAWIELMYGLRVSDLEESC